MNREQSSTRVSAIQMRLSGALVRLEKLTTRVLRAMNPRHASVNRLLRTCRVPRNIYLSRTEEVRFVFNPEIVYARVNLKLNNPVLEIYQNNQLKTKPVFEFSFKSPQDCVQTLGIKLTKFDSATDQPISIIFYDRDGEAPPSIDRKIRLRIRYPFPTNLLKGFQVFPYLVDLLRYTRWYVKYPAIIATIVLLMILVPLFPYRLLPYHEKTIYYAEESLIGVVWPERITEWQDKIQPAAGGTWEKGNEWEYPQAKWHFEKKTDEDGTYGVIHIDGPARGVSKVVGKKSFYDFALRFRVLLQQTDKVEWILREHADGHGQAWYGFLLRRDKNTNHFYFSGYSYSPSEGRSSLDGSNDPVDVLDCCRNGDQFEIKAYVKGFEFRYWLKVENPNEEQPERPPSALNTYYPLDSEGVLLKDRHRWFFSKFRWGNVGLLGSPDPGGQVDLYEWYVTPLEKEVPQQKQ